MILVRILSVLSAIFLVGAFALASLMSPDTALVDLLAMTDDRFVPVLQKAVNADLSPWVWTNMLWPVLQRPGWLLPTAIGLIFFAGALSCSGSHSSSRPRRWRG